MPVPAGISCFGRRWAVKDIQLYIASAIFVLVTVLKLLLPDATETVRGRVVTAIDRDMDYQAVITRLGSAMTDDPVQTVMARLRGEEPAQEVYRPDTVKNLQEETASILPEGWVSSTPIPAETAAPESTPAPTPTPDPVPERVRVAVDAFLTEQAAYSDYDLPATVSYDSLDIPFDYTAPVFGATSSGFGYREHPIENVVKFHYGTDYAVNSGTDILSFADGTVTEVNWDDGYGNYIRIRHEDGWSTLYAHCSQTYVQAGQTVTKGERIALVGDTGETTGPHLHFELLHNGLYTNPEFFL